MFSGIVEAQGRVLEARSEQGLVRIEVERPQAFSDEIKPGDSICCSGVCLTVETLSPERLRFALGAETLAITGWSAEGLKGQNLNLEHSLRLGDRIHGHMVSGHVDMTGELIARNESGGSLFLDIRLPKTATAYLWPKGSWAVNGVSLTINGVVASETGTTVSVCLIPETVKRTNLGEVQPGTKVNIEFDMMARGLIHYFEKSAPQDLTRQDRTGKDRNKT